ncbi:MAG: GNAT family N-acetyltransferase [Gammaproteobacteria bacterium]
MAVDRAGLTDLDALAPLFDAYRRFYGQPADLHGARIFLGNRLKNNESVIFLARLDNVPAGFTQLYPCFSSVRARRTWLLNDLYVAEAARKHGVAATLLDAARRHGEATGAHELTLQTTRDNTPAQALYEKNGWVRQDGFYWYGLELDS